ncbi:hypothetical protein U91I_02728 [alpha proteobacterium U9-1i]|nr:hypothetical protein U91I_02728 [alpha proteobacterium U9-1i]
MLWHLLGSATASSEIISRTAAFIAPLIVLPLSYLWDIIEIPATLAERDRQRIEEYEAKNSAKFSLSVLAPTRNVERVSGPHSSVPALVAVTEFRATYLRLRADALGGWRAYGQVALTALSRSIDGKPFVEVELPHPISMRDEILAHPGIWAVVTFMRVSEADNKLSVHADWPHVLDKIFDLHGLYRATLVASSGHNDGPPQSVMVEVNWSGDWEKLTWRQVSD